MYEKVNPAHPDKIADRIAGALVDLAYQKSKDPKIAVEVLVGHGKCHIIAETSVSLVASRSVMRSDELPVESVWITRNIARTSTSQRTRESQSAAAITVFSRAYH